VNEKLDHVVSRRRESQLRMKLKEIFVNIGSLFAWVFWRLPWGFSVPFIIITIWWVFKGYGIAHDAIFPRQPADTWPWLREFINAWPRLMEFVNALGVVLLLGIGLIIAYNLSVLVNWLLLQCRLKPVGYRHGESSVSSGGPIPDNEFRDVNKIGIVLAGGGAKGAFQAGAMKAIYRYLDEKQALEKVKVIAGTSIGSWNALFWLADLIRPPHGWGNITEQSIHQAWWESISVKSLIAPSWYIPFFRNAFLSTLPWRRVFHYIFKKKQVAHRVASSQIHFYFTRSNVRRGQLTCATNNPSPPEIVGTTYETLDPGGAGNEDAFMDSIGTSIFASMDLPPLFPYAHINGDVYEDGGVIDNVPIVFAAVEGCDLIFVLPLNSDFEEEPNHSSVFFRLFRVMDVRQGVLERNGFKVVYLYNELAALRNYAKGIHAKYFPGQPLPIPAGGGPLETALKRQNEHINIFAICPRRDFTRATIGTHEFWKRKGATEAFRVMYDATWDTLKGFCFGTPKKQVRMGVVSQGKKVTWDEDF
jgi:NTE family protein